jgi:hypothetical protein
VLDRADRLGAARRHFVSTARRRRQRATLALMAAGVAALAWSSWIHLHLWTDGYRHIATIGPLFLMQGIVAAVVALAVLVTRRLEAAAVGVLFLLSTIGGLLLSDWVGLFGFHDHLDAPFAGLSISVEAIGAAALAGALAWDLRRR